ncbi:hypothetical protein BpHYR1_001409 [Brachionus plicatilis]|uniref:Uncharacterized protein n=1 Tax=Brachionus plicatilis TaxID=10195 RepID=A0A3M7RWD9_BRAPC|nr:hypothetical protein BpHYR1_001409 [Brachionus plicatilis]
MVSVVLVSCGINPNFDIVPRVMVTSLRSFSILILELVKRIILTDNEKQNNKKIHMFSKNNYPLKKKFCELNKNKTPKTMNLNII